MSNYLYLGPIDTFTPPSIPRRPYTEQTYGEVEQRFSALEVDYRVLLPMHTGSKSLSHFLHRKGFIRPPKKYIQEYGSADLYPDYVFKIGHLQATEADRDRKLIISVRNPVSRFISKIKMEAMSVSHGREEITEEDLIEATRECFENIYLFDLCKPLCWFLNGREPDYIIYTERQEECITQLPFIQDMDGYESYSDELVYKKDRFKHLKVFGKLSLDPAQRDIVLREMNDKYRDVFNTRFSDDFERFGYKPL